MGQRCITVAPYSAETALTSNLILISALCHLILSYRPTKSFDAFVFVSDMTLLNIMLPLQPIISFPHNPFRADFPARVPEKGSV